MPDRQNLSYFCLRHLKQFCQRKKERKRKGEKPKVAIKTETYLAQN